MPAAYRDSISQQNAGSTITVDPSTLTYVSGDGLVLFVWGYTTLGAPSGSDLTWTQEAAANGLDGFSGDVTGRIYTAVADAAITSFTLSNGANDEYGWNLTSVSGADTAALDDGAAAAYGTSNDPVAPSVSPTGSDSLLLCGAYSMPFNGAGSNAFTPPAGMTEREDVASYYINTVATEALSASGATGTRTFDYAIASTAWIALSIAIKSASVAAGQPMMKRWGGVPHVGGRHAFGRQSGVWG